MFYTTIVEVKTMSDEKVEKELPTDEVVRFVKANMEVITKITEHAPIIIEGNELSVGEVDVKQTHSIAVLCNVCDTPLDIDDSEEVFDHAKEHIEKQEGKFDTNVGDFMEESIPEDDENEDEAEDDIDEIGDFEDIDEDDDEDNDDETPEEIEEEIEEEVEEIVDDAAFYEIDDDGMIDCDQCAKKIDFATAIRVHAYSKADIKDEDEFFVFCSEDCKNEFLTKGDMSYFRCPKCLRLIGETTPEGVNQFNDSSGEKICLRCADE